VSLFGYFVVARHARPLPELPSIRRLCRENADGIDAGSVAALFNDGDWQLLQVLDGSGLSASDLVTETGAPVICVYVMESAVGIIEGATPDSDDWYGCLNPTDAMRAFDLPPELAGSPEQTTRYAARWAESAGRTPDPAAIAAAVDRYVGPFGEGVTAFVEGLGFHFGPDDPDRSSPID
jgi:hypothetical protein